MKTQKVEIEVPVFEGYEFDRFDKPKKGETYFYGDGLYNACSDYTTLYFFIYKKISKKVWVDATLDIYKKYTYANWVEFLSNRNPRRRPMKKTITQAYQVLTPSGKWQEFDDYDEAKKLYDNLNKAELWRCDYVDFGYSWEHGSESYCENEELLESK